MDRPRPRRLRRDGQHTLYVLDEPTGGLHRLVAAGNTVVVIERTAAGALWRLLAACSSG
jgi:hypothetical protein